MTSVASLPDPLQRRLRAKLLPGEAIVWAGQPNPGRYMRSGCLLWLFFIPWTAFSVFWIAAAAQFRLPRFDDGWSFSPLFGLPFLLIGLGGLSAPLWLGIKARSMVYAVTNQRAITIEGKGSIVVRSYPASSIGSVERTEHQDGSGDLVFRTEETVSGRGKRRIRRYGFFAIGEVRNVERLVEAMRRDGGDAGNFR